MSKRQSTDRIVINIRMRESLRVKIEKAAAANGESMNATMVERLERTFRDDEVLAELRAIRTMLSERR